MIGVGLFVEMWGIGEEVKEDCGFEFGCLGEWECSERKLGKLIL